MSLMVSFLLKILYTIPIIRNYDYLMPFEMLKWILLVKAPIMYSAYLGLGWVSYLAFLTD